MNRGYVVLFLLCIFVIVGVLTSLIFYIEEPLSNEQATQREFHFAAIIPSEQELRWEHLKQGLQRGDAITNAATEIMEAKNPKEQLALMDIAIHSHVDGIILYPMGETSYQDAIHKAIAKGIPVITILNDVPDSPRSSFIGETEEFSYLAGREFIGATLGKAEILILTSKKSSYAYEQRMKGVTRALADYPEMKMRMIKEMKTDLLFEMNQVETILKDNPDINAIFGVDAQSVMTAVRLSKKLQMNNLLIMGYDAPPEILDSIQNGEIYGAITQDTDFVGYVAVRYLRDLQLGRWVPETLLPKIRLITRQNVRRYQKDVTEASNQ